MRFISPILLLLSSLLAACVPAAAQNADVGPTGTRSVEENAVISPEPTNTAIPVEGEYEGSRFDEFIFQDALPFDAIRPVYNPEFVPADEAPFVEEELVMGVSINGESKAYPVSVLSFREMVDDELGGLPILVTW